jgi:hypothetical protein
MLYHGPCWLVDGGACACARALLQLDPWLRNTTIRPEFRQGYPLNLSISISGGKETNRDSLSNGERKGMSPACKSPVSGEL